MVPAPTEGDSFQTPMYGGAAERDSPKAEHPPAAWLPDPSGVPPWASAHVPRNLQQARGASESLQWRLLGGALWRDHRNSRRIKAHPHSPPGYKGLCSPRIQGPL